MPSRHVMRMYTSMYVCVARVGVCARYDDAVLDYIFMYIYKYSYTSLYITEYIFIYI